MFRLNKLNIPDKSLGKVKIRKRYHTSDDVIKVVINENGTSFAAATFDKVYYFSESKLQWKLKITNFNSLSMSECGNYLAIGTLNRLIYLDAAHFIPEEVYMEKSKNLPDEASEKYYWITPVKEMDMVVLSPDGKSLVIAEDEKIQYYSSDRQDSWDFDIGDKIWGINFSGDCEIIIAGSGKEVYSFNRKGKLLWQFRTGSLVRYPHLSIEGDKVLVASGKKLYTFSQRGHLLNETDSGTIQALDSSGKLETISGGASTTAFCLSEEGKTIWGKDEKDFINEISVTKNGENIVVATGSDVLNQPAIQSYYRNGDVLWSYKPRGKVSSVAADSSGNHIIAGIGRGLKLFENTIILSRTAKTVSGRCQTIIEKLTKKGMDVGKHHKDFKALREEAENEKSPENLDKLLSLEKELLLVRGRYQMAKETIPNWLESLGVNVQADSDIINGIFPLYNKYMDLNNNNTLSNKKKKLEKRIKELRKTLEALEPGVISKMKKGNHKVKLKQKLWVLSVILETLEKMKEVTDNLDNEKINFIFGLEDTARNLIIDHLSGEKYEEEIQKVISHVEKFEDKIEKLLHRMQKFEATMNMWRNNENLSPIESMEINEEPRRIEEENELKFIIRITNNYETKISKVSLRAFTNNPIYNFIEPDHGVHTLHTDIPQRKSEDFWFRIRSDISKEVIVNSVLIFELDKKEYMVKLPTYNANLLLQNVDPFNIKEVEYSKIMEDNENYRDSLILMDADLQLVLKYFKNKFGKFNNIREKKAVTHEGDVNILWYAGKIGEEEMVLVTTVIRELEKGHIEIGISAYCQDIEKAKIFVNEPTTHFRSNYKVIEKGD